MSTWVFILLIVHLCMQMGDRLHVDLWKEFEMVYSFGICSNPQVMLPGTKRCWTLTDVTLSSKLCPKSL